jgi:HAD superfamily hydrolase (TIGR01509 family)
MKIKLIIFDLDGVLVESRDLHYQAFNKALEEIDPKFVISRDEHLSKYDGNTTTTKLHMLTKDKGLSIELYDKIWELKQKYTYKIINEEYEYDDKIRNVLKSLKNDGYTLYCASNSIYNTVKIVLLRKGFMEYFDWFVSNQDITRPKPNPEIYLKCFQRANVSPKEVLILEDSHIGREAALKSGAHLFPIESPNCVILDTIYKYIKDYNESNKYINMTTPWKQSGLNVLIPLSGKGSRFAEQGYVLPKPLIETLDGKPMIQLVVENLNIDAHYIFVVQKEHCDKYNLNYVLNLISPGCDIVIIDGITEGAVCSILKAREFIDNDKPLLLANSDQFLEWNSNEFLYSAMSEGVDGCISVFTATSPKWSFVKTDENGWVTEVAEKKPISNIATTGIYFLNHGSDFVKYADQMIADNFRVNDEFYTCPVFNWFIKDNKKIKIKYADRMHGLGIPKDLEYFLNHYKKD